MHDQSIHTGACNTAMPDPVLLNNGPWSLQTLNDLPKSEVLDSLCPLAHFRKLKLTTEI